MVPVLRAFARLVRARRGEALDALDYSAALLGSCAQDERHLMHLECNAVAGEVWSRVDGVRAVDLSCALSFEHQ